VELLKLGYQVRGTVRSLQRSEEVQKAVAEAGADLGQLDLVTTDLLKDDGWEEAVAGCRFVLHVASPFLLENPQHEDDLIKPAVDGTLRVMSACAKAKIEKLVLTSSVAAIQIGHVAKNDFDESDWSVIRNCPPYPKSKTLAERAAWDFIGRLPEQQKYSLTVLNPALVTGPMLSDDIGTSNELISQMISGRMPACPRLHMGVIDVRDVAKAHVHVMNEPSTDGMRIIMSQNELLFSSIGKVLRSEGFAKAPIHEIPTFLIKFLALFVSQLKGIRPSVGKEIRFNKKRALECLPWEFVSAEQSIKDTAKQLQLMKEL